MKINQSINQSIHPIFSLNLQWWLCSQISKPIFYNTITNLRPNSLNSSPPELASSACTYWVRILYGGLTVSRHVTSVSYWIPLRKMNLNRQQPEWKEKPQKETCMDIHMECNEAGPLPLLLGSLFRSIDLHVCFCASTKSYVWEGACIKNILKKNIYIYKLNSKRLHNLKMNKESE